jgi:hypothetical protein
MYLMLFDGLEDVVSWHGKGYSIGNRTGKHMKGNMVAKVDWM